MFSFEPIGTLRTVFTEKFGAPRQSRMIPAAVGTLKLGDDSRYRQALEHLDRFSHVWLVYVFHHHLDLQHREPWRPLISPPRVDAPKNIGVFASRSPHRPNPIGLSVVKLERVMLDAPGGIEIEVSGVDILDGTPVLDIKPYLPFADRVDEANSGWALGSIVKYPVSFSEVAIEKLRQIEAQHPRFRALLTQMLELDPRPTSQRRLLPIESDEADGRVFAFRVQHYDVQWIVRDRAIWVADVVDA